MGTGIARKIRQKAPQVTIVAVDPVGSILALPDSLNDHKRLEAYHVEGIGYDFVPTVLQQTIADSWVKTDDRESFKFPRATTCQNSWLTIGCKKTDLVILK